MYTATAEKMTDTFNKKDSTNSGLKNKSSNANDEEKDELSPGFKDVDAFVKVAEFFSKIFCSGSVWSGNVSQL